MEKVDYMANSDVVGWGLNPSVESPGELYAAFPTEPIGKLCLPTKEVGVEILE